MLFLKQSKRIEQEIVAFDLSKPRHVDDNPIVDGKIKFMTDLFLFFEIFYRFIRGCINPIGDE